VVVPAGNPASLASALELLIQDDELSAKLGSAARERVEADFSRGAMVAKFEAFYERLCFPLP
jgi:glycosyltransferase involved in cell wall biosynthesis